MLAGGPLADAAGGDGGDVVTAAVLAVTAVGVAALRRRAPAARRGGSGWRSTVATSGHGPTPGGGFLLAARLPYGGGRR